MSELLNVGTALPSEGDLLETLIVIEPMRDARAREHYEGLKARASDVHNWPNRLEL